MTARLFTRRGVLGATPARSFAALACLVLLAGCSKAPERVAVVPVSGVLTVEGEPAEGAQISLHPISGIALEKNLHPLAKVGPDGSFKVSTYDTHDGAPVGEYALTVQWRLLVYPEGEDADPKLGPNLVAAEYAKADSTEWKVTVSGAGAQLEPVDLPTQPEQAKRPVVKSDE